jgi:ADP-heptose:LPS heptosyltransferase
LFEEIRSSIRNIFFSGIVAETRKNTLMVLKLDSIGDYVLFRNFLETLRSSEKYKHYDITLCGNSWWRELSQDLDKAVVDHFIWVDYNRLTDHAYLWKMISMVRNNKFETLIHPTYSRDAFGDEIVKFSGARFKIGYNGDLVNITPSQKLANDKSYTTLISSPVKVEFEYLRNHYFFEKVLGTQIPIKRPHIEMPTVIDKKIIICPGAKDGFRRWSPGNFASLCAMLESDFPDHDFLICGSASDSIAAEEIIKSSPVSIKNLVGNLTLTELLGVFSSAEFIITNDSGPFHLAVALDKNVICISNGNNYGRFTPYPPLLKSTGIVIHPNALTEIDTEEKRLALYGKHGSALDINSIGVSKVYETIKANFFRK